MTPFGRSVAAARERGDRFHFIARQIERLDDRAFAGLLAWLDGYADSRWAGRCATDGRVVAAAIASSPANGRGDVAPPTSHDAYASGMPALEWVACEPVPSRGYAPSRPLR